MRLILSALAFYSSISMAQLNPTSANRVEMTVILNSVTCNSSSEGTGTAKITPMRLVSNDELELGLAPYPGRALDISAVNSKGKVETKGMYAPSTQSKTVNITMPGTCGPLKADFDKVVAATKRCGNAIFAKMKYLKSNNSAIISDLQFDSHICL